MKIRARHPSGRPLTPGLRSNDLESAIGFHADLIGADDDDEYED